MWSPIRLMSKVDRLEVPGLIPPKFEHYLPRH